MGPTIRLRTPAKVAGNFSEWWPGSIRNPGRDQIGMVAGITSESATVVEWIGSPEGRSPNAMDLTGRRLQRINASEKIEGLMKELITEPQIKQALAAEYERREASRQKARAVSNDLSSTAASESRYEPMPSSYVLSSTLRDLVVLLNERASADEIAEAARKVRNDQQAAEEVYQHGVGLAVAYTQALQDRPVTHISQDRSRGRDF